MYSAAELNALVVQVNALTPSVHGVVKRANVLNHLVSVRIPRVVHAQVNLIARTLEQQGLARLWQEPNLYYGTTAGLHARQSTRLDPEQYYARLQPTFFSLPGMLSATKIRMDIIKDLYVPVIAQLVKAGDRPD
jgi:hypothetical protein